MTGDDVTVGVSVATGVGAAGVMLANVDANCGAHTGPSGMLAHCTAGILSTCPL